MRRSKFGRVVNTNQSSVASCKRCDWTYEMPPRNSMKCWVLANEHQTTVHAEEIELSRKEKQDRRRARGMNTENLLPAPNFKETALCGQVGLDPDLWFSDEKHEQEMAIKVCNACPAREECLAFSLNIRYGIWGGLTEDQRVTLMRRTKVH